MVSLHIVKPCPESWDRMSAGDGRTRHCDACEKDVHDLRSVDDAGALAYVRAHGGVSLCVRMLVVTTAVTACGAGEAPLPPPAIAIPVAPVARPRVRPVTDSDKDGVADAADACPMQPGQASADPHKNGCPQFVVVESMGALIILEQVHFQRGSRTLPSETFPIIDATIQVMKSNPEVHQLAIEGHASSDEASAQALSEARAKAVLARLVAGGIDAKRLIARGLGASRPIDDDKTSEGRARNRRVEFRIVDPTEASASRDASCPPAPPSSLAP
ncbi:MAG TPA: OmpA family protein [Polyangiaceae bacterium]